MENSDALEGLAKNIIYKLFQVFAEDRLDDSEYVRNVRAVIEGTEAFVHENEKFINDSKKLTQPLYVYSKQLWLSHLKDRIEREGSEDKTDTFDADYNDYYFDYIYTHNVYPR